MFIDHIYSYLVNINHFRGVNQRRNVYRTKSVSDLQINIKPCSILFVCLFVCFRLANDKAKSKKLKQLIAWSHDTF